MKFAQLRTMWRDRNQREGLYSTPEYWDAKAEQFSGDSASMWPNPSLNGYYHTEQIRHLIHFLPTVRGLSVLDLGCGTGRISRFLASRGGRVLGIDFSPKAIHAARSLTEGTNPAYRVQSLFCLEDERAFDVVISTGCLAMACKDERDLRNVLLRVRQALKPNGMLILLEHIHRGFLHRVLDLDLPGCCEVLRQAGFETREMRQMHFWPSRLVLAFIRWPAWFTSFGYHCGQTLMKLPGFRQMGDYTALCAAGSVAPLVSVCKTVPLHQPEILFAQCLPSRAGATEPNDETALAGENRDLRSA